MSAKVRVWKLTIRSQFAIRFKDGIPSFELSCPIPNFATGTIVDIINRDLKLLSLKLKIRQELTLAQIRKRRVRCRQLLIWIINEGQGKIRFFSDEEMFTVERAVNRQNDRWLARDPKDVPIVGRTKLPQSVQVVGVVSSEGDVIPPYFFRRGQRINADVYLNVLSTLVKPWMDTIADGRSYVFQHIEEMDNSRWPKAIRTMIKLSSIQLPLQKRISELKLSLNAKSGEEEISNWNKPA